MPLFSFCFRVLICSEKCRRHSSRSRMGSHDTADLGIFQILHMAFPELSAVMNVILQEFIRSSRISQKNRQAVIHAVLLRQLHQQIVGLLCAPGFAENKDLSLLT